MIPAIRTLSHQLSEPAFTSPKELLIWMGAVQAQEYQMAKWALGVRLKAENSSPIVQAALDKGEIVRTHIMRPTWHFVPGEDLKWMLSLTASRIQAAMDSYGKRLQIPAEFYVNGKKALEKILEGNKSLTKQEIATELQQYGIITDNAFLTSLLYRSETVAMICSGIDRKDKPTYALVEERISYHRELNQDEALATLAIRYFQSHSPATLQDFIWWSGLTSKEAQKAIHLIKSELVEEIVNSCHFFIHQSCKRINSETETIHLLPSYDEYLISYKDRSHVLHPTHYANAFNNYGIFYPVIFYKGEIVGNWKKSITQKKQEINTTFFKDISLPESLLNRAISHYKRFITKD